MCRAVFQLDGFSSGVEVKCGWVFFFDYFKPRLLRTESSFLADTPPAMSRDPVDIWAF